MSKVKVKDAVVFITGANRPRGIGRSLVEEAVKRGAKKVYATARDVSQLADLASKYPKVVVPLSLDVTNNKDVEQAVKKAGDTTILINNSGYAGYSGICFNYDDKIARQELEVNYFGLIHLTRAFCKPLLKNKNGTIVNVVSIAGYSSFPMCATYSASKAAAHSLTQAVRAELKPHGISVFGVYPGPIDTDMADEVKFPKETPANVAIRVFDGVEKGVEDITTDTFADDFVKKLRKDPKLAEKDIGDFVHKMPADF